DKVTVVAAGVTLFEALKAADALKQQGIGITVIDAYSVKPLGKQIIKEAAQKTGNTVITVEDHYPEGGLGDAVAGELSADGFKLQKGDLRAWKFGAWSFSGAWGLERGVSCAAHSSFLRPGAVWPAPAFAAFASAFRRRTVAPSVAMKSPGQFL